MNEGTTTAAAVPDARTLRLRFRRNDLMETRAVNPGELFGVSFDLAVQLVLVGDAEPTGWAPTAEELRTAAERLLAELEEQREARGFSLEFWIRGPELSRYYGAIARVLGPAAATK